MLKFLIPICFSGLAFVPQGPTSNKSVYNGTLVQDTLTIDERLETPQMYVYHEVEDGEKIFHRFGGGKHMSLKWVKNGRPFTGILTLLSEDGKQICPYLNGVPEGIWTKVTINGNLEYEVPIKAGYYHGECKFYRADSKDELRLIGKFLNGYPDGQFVVYSYYVNTNDVFEAERFMLKTIINNPLKANRPFLDSDDDSRGSVSGVYVADVNPKAYLPPLEPTNDLYWGEVIGCGNHSTNPLPAAQTILEGEYIQKDVFTDEEYLNQNPSGKIKLENTSFWKNGRCLWFEQYNETPDESNTVTGYGLVRRSEYEYYNGYFIETRTTRTLSYIHFSTSNLYNGSVNAQDLTSFDTIVVQTSTYINGRLRHGLTKAFTDESSPSISAPENKFSVNFNYSEGEYYLNTKVGEWKYYIVTDGAKRLVCVTNYLRPPTAEFSGFTPKQPFKRFCNTSFFGDEEKKHGTEKFYRLNDGTLYVGYTYKNNAAVSLIKE